MKITKYITLMFLAFASFACELDQENPSQTSTRDYYRNAEEINSAVLGCYNSLYGVMYYEWALTELRSDNTRMYGTGSSANTSKLIEELDQATISTSNDWVNDYWEHSYKAIFNCNKVLENIGVVSDATQKAQYEGEAQFLRAHLYFNMVRLWGPVFIVTTSLSPSKSRYQQRATLDEVYDLIEGDLEAVVNNAKLPVVYPDAQIGRANLSAAKALLAKVYMTRYTAGQGKYTDGGAGTLIDEVIAACGNPASGSQLVPFADIFDTSKEMNKEIIFNVRYLAGGQGLGSPFGNLFAPSLSGQSVIVGDGNAYNYPSTSIITAFKAEAGDKRLNVSLAESYFNIISQTEVTKDPCRYVKKYTSPVTTRYDGESDWPVIRLGDVLLLKAELTNELHGPTADALKYLNMTRTRAGLTPKTALELPSKYTFRETLRKERRLELAFENQHWFDLLRWGIAAQTVSYFLTQEESAFYSGYSYAVGAINNNQTMLPIPLAVMNINPKIAQNPGY